MDNQMKNCLTVICTASVLCLKSEDEIHGCNSPDRCIVNDVSRHSLFKLKLPYLSFLDHGLDLMHRPRIHHKILRHIPCWRRNLDDFLFKDKPTPKSFAWSFWIIEETLDWKSLPTINFIFITGHSDSHLFIRSFVGFQLPFWTLKGSIIFRGIS